MARIEPSEITAWNGAELAKRQHVPFRVADACPKCSAQHVCDLGADDHHLYCAKQGEPTRVYFVCKKCDHDWSVLVVARFTLELAPNTPKED